MRRAWLAGRRLFLILLTALLVLSLLAGYREARVLCRAPVSVQPALLAFRQQVTQQAGTAAASPLAPVGALIRHAAEQGTTMVLRFKNQDVVAYPAHVALATALEHLRCSPGAVAVQWLKAGAHAATPQQRAAVQAGLLRQAARLGGAQELATYLRRFLNPSYDPRGNCTLRRLEGTVKPRDACG